MHNLLCISLMKSLSLIRVRAIALRIFFLDVLDNFFDFTFLTFLIFLVSLSYFNFRSIDSIFSSFPLWANIDSLQWQLYGLIRTVVEKLSCRDPLPPMDLYHDPKFELVYKMECED